MAAMSYKGSVFIITIFFFFIVLLSLPLSAYSSSTKSFYWLGETENMKAMKKEKEIKGIQVEERRVPTGSDPLHHKLIPFTSP
ncbi:unnamed protein product [Cochlearia groenlandica]